MSSAVDRFNEATGGKGHVDLRFRDFFTAVFRHHTREEAEELFACGSPSTTPPVKDISADWPKPWLYSRVFLGLLLTLTLCCAMWSLFEISTIFPDIMFIGALFVPVSVVVFFFETNAPRNISISRVVLWFFIGGVLSLFFVGPLLQIFQGAGVGAFVPAMLTGLVEEIAKIAAIAILMSLIKSRNYILNGLLIGAAVGAGFAVFESAGYAFSAFLEAFEGNIAGIAAGTIDLSGFSSWEAVYRAVYDVSYQGAVDNIVLRALLAIGGHVAWAAAEGAALAFCEEGGRFRWSQLLDFRFLAIAAVCIVLHGVWDMQIPFFDEFCPLAFVPIVNLIPVIYGIPLKYFLLIVAIWIVLMVMLNRGLAQVNELTDGADDKETEPVGERS